jgi:uncharacterized NAD(P)/FAD-binding protein YdhS
MMSPSCPRTIVIVGAGFSGSMTAVNLLRLSAGRAVHVVLVNRSGRMARGIAYGTASPEHVLNVPAGNMSALASEPDDFLRYCRWANPQVQPSSFVSRRLYGSYLEALLDAAEHGAHPAATLSRVVGEVRSVRPGTDTAARVELADGTHIAAHRVVLAFGHFAPQDPPVSTPAFYASPRYVRDPWAPGALAGVGPDERVLLLGTGLTSVDVLLSLSRRPRTAQVWAVSRRGLLPQAHRDHASTLDPAAQRALIEQMGGDVRGCLRAVRAAIARHAERGGDWRDVVASLRPHTPALWQGLGEAQRARFLRRLQPYWEVARHRCAPQAFERFQALRGEGQVQHLAGRVLGYEEAEHHVDVRIQPRGGGDALRLKVQRVINCTGRNTHLPAVQDALVRQLLREGLMQPDARRLGLQVDDAYAVVDASGRGSTALRYVGPLLRARDWEATAVPELRMHAHRLAQALLDE